MGEIFVGSRAAKDEGRNELQIHRPRLHLICSLICCPLLLSAAPAIMRLLVEYRKKWLKATCGYAAATQLWAAQKKE